MPTTFGQLETGIVVASASGAPGLRLDVEGGLALRSGAVAVTTDDQVLTVGNRSFFIVTSNSTTASTRTLVLSDGLVVGQMLTLVNGGTNTFDMVDSFSNVNIPLPNTLLTGSDSITFIWNGTDWIQTGFNDND